MAEALKPWRIDRIYGFTVGRDIVGDGGDAIARSAEAYIRHIES